jgi:erythromycin esterase-like protein
MRVPSAIEESWEYVLHEAFEGDRLMIFAGDPGPELMDPRGHRAIGVVYNPGYERRGNYVPTVLRRRYDALLHVDETAALHPIQMEATDRTEVPETFPSGV